VCGRYVTGTDEHDWRSWATLLGLSTEVVLAEVRAARPDPSRAFVPTTSVPILRRGPERIELAWARWGLAPSWMDRPLQRPPQYNVRIETAPSKFKKYMQTRRCLLPASGFWLARKAGHEGVFVRGRDHAVLAFAGLWTERELDGDTLRSCTMLTTEADAALSRFHERMPIVLTVEHAERWLDPTCSNAELDELTTSPALLAVA
jgi:putative SOS response-associated peptidase YedK